MSGKRAAVAAGLLALLGPPGVAAGQASQRTEFQLQSGRAVVSGVLSPPNFQHTLTLQHASTWSHGDNFFFVDMVCCEEPVSNRDMYLEWYSTFSVGALTGREIRVGPVRDVGVIWGLNWGAQPVVSVLAPGVRLALDLPGFVFANLDFNWLVDRSAGVSGGGVPRADAHLGVDFNWARPFSLAGGSFSVEGHGEWHAPSRLENGAPRPYTLLLQPQVRFDVGRALWGAERKILAGTELQVWRNKFGTPGVHEFLPQLLLVWGF